MYYNSRSEILYCLIMYYLMSFNVLSCTIRGASMQYSVLSEVLSCIIMLHLRYFMYYSVISELLDVL